MLIVEPVGLHHALVLDSSDGTYRVAEMAVDPDGVGLAWCTEPTSDREAATLAAVMESAQYAEPEPEQQIATSGKDTTVIEGTVLDD